MTGPFDKAVARPEPLARSRLRITAWTTRLCLWVIAASVGTACATGDLGYRLEVGGGYVHGDYRLSTKSSAAGTGVAFKSDSAVSSSGPLVMAAGWVDNAIADNFSLGLEYQRYMTDSDLELDTRRSNISTTIDADASLDVDVVMVNAAYRPNVSGLHPFIGVGLGAAWFDPEIRTKVDQSSGGAVVVDFDEEYPAPAAQLFAGLDFDLTEHIYAGGVVRFLVFEGRVFNEDQAVRLLSAGGKLGMRF